jgi:hypothetical protein
MISLITTSLADNITRGSSASIRVAATASRNLDNPDRKRAHDFDRIFVLALITICLLPTPSRQSAPESSTISLNWRGCKNLLKSSHNVFISVQPP